ncbi:hypothetical protein [Streptococcus parasanguinis]|uniref:hypothetical protein n=1 Tax=Streptococcus parasanguinis TaxID=1318 RepID=UPI001F5007F0|nr:hypothetical protein [Streptococcus parasanguinis]
MKILLIRKNESWFSLRLSEEISIGRIIISIFTLSSSNKTHSTPKYFARNAGVYLDERIGCKSEGNILSGSVQ